MHLLVHKILKGMKYGFLAVFKGPYSKNDSDDQDRLQHGHRLLHYAGQNKLTALPASIVRCIGLERLGLHANLLTDLPTDFDRLGALTSLDLSGNRLCALDAFVTAVTGSANWKKYQQGCH